MRAISRAVLATVVLAAASQANAEITFYADENFQGGAFTDSQRIGNVERKGFNNRASSAAVTDERWEVCDEVRFRGRCLVLRPGNYPTLSSIGLNNGIASARAIAEGERVDRKRYAPAPAPSNITFYEDESFRGRSFSTDARVDDFRKKGFNDRISSMVVTGPDRWEACEDIHFEGRCVQLRPGRYDTMRGTGLNNRISSVRNIASKAPARGQGQIALFGQEGFGGRAFRTEHSLDNLEHEGFSDRASSVVVAGDAPWEVCDDNRFEGRCRVLRPGQYPSLADMGMNNRISSVRELDPHARTDERRYAPLPLAVPDYRRRKNERLFTADVKSVHAVVGPPERRCWIERDQVAQNQSDVNAPGAVLGALLGGVLGHQVGGGSGKDIATAGGAIAGAVLGSKFGNNSANSQARSQDVQRCETVPSQSAPQYWDVTYEFRGETHRVQMATPPGRTITVNERGEPRV